MHQPQRFAHHVHVVADIGLILRRNSLEFLVARNFTIQIFDQFAHGQHCARLKLSGANVVGHFVARTFTEHALRIDMAIENPPGLLRRDDEVLHLRRTDGVVERVSRRNRADQDQRDQPHPFLPVIRSVEETDAGAGQHHQRANGERRRLLVLGRLYSSGNLISDFERRINRPAIVNPSSGEISSAFNTLIA